jgi:ankyrin repeat protein
MKIQRFFAKRLVTTLLITLIVSTTWAEIPFTEAGGIYIATKDEYKDISPFWAMVAVHGKLLERIRFFGFYNKKFPDQDQIQNQRPRDEAFKGDKIAELLLKLFPSPDGLQFVANAHDELFKNLSKPENLIKINNIIKKLLSNEKKEVKTKGIHDEITSLTSSKSMPKDFSKLLVEAYDQQENYANPSKLADQRYPKNIVIISLLSFFVKVADNKTQLIQALPLLFSDTAIGEIVNIPPYTKEGYNQNKQQQKENEDFFPTIIKNLQDPTQVELAFLMAKGFEAYERLVAEPINYRQGIHIKGANEAFSDCGETSLRNIFMLLLSAGNGGVVAGKSIDALEAKIQLIDEIELANYTPYDKFKKFIQTNFDITQGTSKEIHDAWAELVSNLNENSPATETNRIQYGRSLSGIKTDALVYEIKSYFSKIGAISIINMFNVIARIIPDKILNQAWTEGNDEQHKQERYKQSETKLDRLCELFSRDNMTVSWKNESSATKNINTDFITIIFTINDADAFKWIFKVGHFDTERIINSEDDWRSNFNYSEYPNEWMASLFPRSLAIQKEKEYAALFPMTVIYNPLLRTFEGIKRTIGIVSDKKMKNFYPLISRWILHSIHPDNPNFVLSITDFLIKLPISLINDKEKDNIIQSILKIVGKNQNLVALALKNKQDEVAKLFIEKEVDPNAKDENENAPLHLAVSKGNTDIVSMLIKAKATINITDKDDQTPLHLAASQKKVEIVDMLIKAGANLDLINKNGLAPLHIAIFTGNIENTDTLINANANLKLKANSGNTPLHFAVSKPNMEAIVDKLIRANVDIDEKNKPGFTPLHLAVINRNLNAVNILLQHGANPNTTETKKQTPLISITARDNMNDMQQQQYIEIMKLLIDKNADINAKDSSEQTCLDYAIQEDHNLIVKFLQTKLEQEK